MGNEGGNEGRVRTREDTFRVITDSATYSERKGNTEVLVCTKSPAFAKTPTVRNPNPNIGR